MVESLTDLPPNILLEILVRLPLKSLFTSKCVCKAFLNLTSPNPHFIHLHSSNRAQALVFQFGDVFKPSRRLHLLEPELGTFQFKPIFEVPRIDSSTVVYHRNLPEENKFVLVNSCNGFLYFVRRHAPDERSLICNPITNEYVRIPDVGIEIREFSRTKSMWLGFSPRTNQYKVLRVFSSIYGEPMEIGAQVLVVGSSSWREIEYTPLGSDHSWDACFAFLNGVIYWLDHSRNGVVFFDFEREVFGEIELPFVFGEDQLRNMSIGVLGGRLSLSYNDSDAHHMDIWVMKKPGNQVAWSKEFNIDTMTSTGRPVYGKFKPLQILRNGEILMFWTSNKNNDMFSYDLKSKRLSLVGFNRWRLNPKAVAFTPSFISLKDALLVDKVIEQKVRPRGHGLDL